MTVVGKLLVFLNLVFSLAVGTFAVLDYAARTHWADRYQSLSKKYQVVDASSQAWKAEAAKLEKDRKALNARLIAGAGPAIGLKGLDDPAADEAAQRAAKVIEERGRAIEKLQGDVAKLQGQLAAAEKRTRSSDATSEASLAETKARQTDSDKAREILKAETEKNIRLVKEMNELRDRAVAAEIQAGSYKDMNTRLERQLQEIARDMARLRASAGSTGVARGVNPPPENVEGLVRGTDPSGLVTITIGSDAGLQKGHTMEVFRLGQNPKYIGRIKIVDVHPTTAVAQPAGRMMAPMKPGDRVASRIMGN
jgi:hypothetical protein